MYSFFKDLGLNQKEIDSFLTLIKRGACTVSDWAKYANIKRPTMYVLLQRLQNIGLITTFEKKGVMYVEAIPVDSLSSIFKQRHDQLAQGEALLKQYSPELEKMEKTSAIKPGVKFYEGKNRVEQAYEEVLKEKSFKAFFNPERVKQFMPEYFYKIPDTIKKTKRQVQELLIDCTEGKEYQKLYQSSLHHIKLLKKTTAFSSDTIITSEKIYLIGYGETDIVATEIWNKELAETQSTLFDMIWSSQVKSIGS